jgi:GT2 family glycosyltransferase
MTSHNRVGKTRRCLQSIARQGVPIEVILNDDGSTDGTGQVARRFDFVRVVRGSGADFWAGGMRRAWANIDWPKTSAVALLNDDVELDPGALRGLLEILRHHEPMLLGAAVRSPDDGTPTYGGYSAANSLRRMKLRLVEPGNGLTDCDTLNGNILLMDRKTAQQLGGLSPRFTHGMADFDLAWRAGDRGYRVALAPGTWGSCENNPSAGRWSDRSLPRRARWRKLMSPTGLPPREYLYMCKEHGGPLWLVDYISPYARVLMGR